MHANTNVIFHANLAISNQFNMVNLQSL